MTMRVSSPELVGRQSELRELRVAVEAADRGESGPVVVVGEAGVGKTRLVNELATWAHDTGHRVLIGGCVALSAEVAPFAPLLQALRSVGEPRPASSSVTAGTLSNAGTSSNARIALGISPDGSHGRALEVLLAALVELADAQPTILMVEDVQWVDASTADALAFLVHNLRSEPLQLIITYRADGAPGRRHDRSVIAELARHPRYRQIELEPLDRAQTAGLLSGILNRPIGGQLLDEIYHRSQGNPLLAEELLAARTTDRGLPLTLREALGARLSQLSPEAQDLVRVASAAGREFSESLLAGLADADPATFRAGVRAAVELNFLVRESHDDTNRLRFRHALMQELLYADLLASERTHLHAAAATAIEAELANRGDAVLASELAYHWQAADRPDRALGAAISAGLAAEAAHAPAEAATQFERALALRGRLTPESIDVPLDHIGLLEHAAANLLSDPARAAGHVRTAIDLVDADKEPVRAGLLHAALGRYLWFAGDGHAALDACRAAVRLVGARGTPAERARVLAGLAQILMILADFDEADGFAREAIELAQRAGETLIESHALCTLGTVVAYEGDLEAGLDLLRRALDRARELGSDDDIGRAVANIVDVQIICGRYADAIESERRALAMEPPLSGVWVVLSTLDAAWALYASGEWEQALDALERARIYPASGIGEIEWVLRRVQLLVARGDFDAAATYFDTLDRLLETSADTQWIAPAATARAEYAVWTGEFDAACQVIRRALDRVRPSIGANVSRIGPMLAMGLRAAADGSLDPETNPRSSSDAALFLERMRSIRDDTAVRWPGHLRLAEPWLALCEAEASRMTGGSDPERWAAAARHFEGFPMPYHVAYAEFRRASAALAVRRDSAAGREALRRAAAIGRRLGARPLLAEIIALANRANVPLDARSIGRRPLPAGLSERELEVLALMAEGMTNREIGEHLFITPKTASHHVSNILGKLGVRSRSKAAAEAARLGVLGDASEGMLPVDQSNEPA